MELQAYFHLKYSRTSKNKPVKSGNDVRVISISSKKEGPFYLFKRGDRLPDQHIYLNLQFKQQSDFVKYRNLSVKLTGPTLRTYFDLGTKRFKFKDYFLEEVHELNPSYSGKNSFSIYFFYLFIFLLFNCLFIDYYY
jgi:hypothetical protein